MTNPYLWVIGGGQLQIPLINEANLLGLKTVVSDQNEDCIARKYCDNFAHIDIFDIQEHLNYLKQTPLNIVGVLAAGIDAPETMAAMNELLGLKGVSFDVALICKHKELFRQKLKELEYDVPEFVLLHKGESDKIEQIVKPLPFPVIVKPTCNSASRDMKIFERYSDELKAFILQNLQKYPCVLVEQMWQGEEQTVECLIDINGKFHNGFITDRKFTFKDGYPVETGLVHPTELELEKQHMLFALAKQIACDFGIDVGAVKLDTIVTRDGPRIIELTVRHSGGFDCQYLVPKSTGKNILKAAILTAIQEEFDPQLLQPQYKRFGQTASPWPEPGIIQSIVGIEQAKQISGIEEIFMRYETGETVEPYINCARRTGFIIATGTTREKANQSIQDALNTIKIETV